MHYVHALRHALTAERFGRSLALLRGWQWISHKNLREYLYSTSEIYLAPK